MSSAGGGMSLPGGDHEASDSDGSSSPAEESDDGSDDGVRASAPQDEAATGQAKESGPSQADARQHGGAGRGSGKVKPRRGRHQGIQEL
jgi:hypothetical protein